MACRSWARSGDGITENYAAANSASTRLGRVHLALRIAHGVRLAPWGKLDLARRRSLRRVRFIHIREILLSDSAESIHDHLVELQSRVG